MSPNGDNFIYGYIVWPTVEGSSQTVEPVSLDNVRATIEHQVRNTKVDAKQEFAFLKPNSSTVRASLNQILAKEEKSEMYQLAMKLHEKTNGQSGVGFLVFLKQHRHFYICRYPSDKKGLLPRQDETGNWYIEDVNNVFRRRNNYFKSTVFDIHSNGTIGTRALAYDLQNRDFKVSNYWGQEFLEMAPTKSAEHLNKYFAIALRDAYHDAKNDTRTELLKKISTLQAIPRRLEKTIEDHILDLQLSKSAEDLLRKKIDLDSYGGAQFLLDYDIQKKVIGIQVHDFESGIELSVPDDISEDCGFIMETDENTGKTLTRFSDTLKKTRVTKSK
ncbi:MAG: hypothetical protein HQK65_02025 [Desulfamplus sp.]|nr:hypothetical protein [Desulfamplus sp.]